MKNIITLLSFILIITSCDVVEGPYEIDTGALTPSDTNTYVKKILIEDYTGHTCPNCPAAARELEAIHNIYGDKIIGIAIHASTGFAAPWTGSGKFEYDFRTKWGDDWDNFFNISNSGLPRGMVNRSGYPNSHKLGKNEWLTAVITELEKEIDFGVSITTNNTENEGAITINSEILNDINGDYKLVVCLIESSIINWQKDGGDNIEEYEHNHTLRTVLTNESLTNSSSYITGQVVQKIINYNLNTLEQLNINYSNNTADAGNGNSGGWNPSNMSVVAYIYDNITHEILQAEESHLITK